MPEPTKEGYSFDHWEGSSYKAGDKYVVTEDHTFLAIWDEDPAEVTPEPTVPGTTVGPTRPGTTISPTKAAVTGSAKSGKVTPTTMIRRTQTTAAAARAKTAAENKSTGTTPTARSGGSKTGDNTNVLLYIVIFVLSASVVIGLISYRKKKHS